ncbi:uncharacterized protein LOC122252930 [Penaeus japonicus]|uniref:uncharacterized protein LOC122252930 n=1 Tax=Penaeus japonicus TaxID=27405 RepID=UPI001C71166A|nr:uncharacterized protein LOC122252930 [Penaeus japonicus]
MITEKEERRAILLAKLHKKIEESRMKMAGVAKKNAAEPSAEKNGVEEGKGKKRTSTQMYRYEKRKSLIEESENKKRKKLIEESKNDTQQRKKSKKGIKKSLQRRKKQKEKREAVKKMKKGSKEEGVPKPQIVQTPKIVVPDETMTLTGDLLKTYWQRRALRDSRCLCVVLDNSGAKPNFKGAQSVRFKMHRLQRMCFVEYRTGLEAEVKKYEIQRCEGVSSVQFAGTLNGNENNPLDVNPYQ